MAVSAFALAWDTESPRVFRVDATGAILTGAPGVMPLSGMRHSGITALAEPVEMSPSVTSGSAAVPVVGVPLTTSAAKFSTPVDAFLV